MKESASLKSKIFSLRTSAFLCASAVNLLLNPFTAEAQERRGTQRRISTGVEQAGYSRAGGLDTKMIVRERRRETAARRPIEKSDLN
jgi:hypothetical protein